MKSKKLNYSFDDEVANRFCYDMDNKKIEVFFSGYYVPDGSYVNKSCIFIIKNWTHAKSKLSLESLYTDFNTYFGIISMIISAEMKESNFEMTINTTDNRYVDLIFNGPELHLLKT